jgi:hypothetical protein
MRCRHTQAAGGVADSVSLGAVALLTARSAACAVRIEGRSESLAVENAALAAARVVGDAVAVGVVVLAVSRPQLTGSESHQACDTSRAKIADTLSCQRESLQTCQWIASEAEVLAKASTMR